METGGAVARRFFDVAGAGFLMFLSLPVLVPAVVLARLLHGRPVFFGHRRIGRGGRPFVCWKLRTMEVGAEERLAREEELGSRYREHGYKLPTGSDPRVTAFGRWLRRSYVDELPQLWNVLRGDLSLVGPRPVVEEELAEFGEGADEVLSVRPGIFGAWVSLGPDRPAYPRRAEIELAYVRQRSWITDLAILTRSAWTILQGEPGPPGEDVGPHSSEEALGTLRRTLSNANALFFAYLLPRGFAFLSVIVAARALGTTEFGAYGTAAAFAVILSIIATLGMTQLLIRDIAREPERAPNLIRAAHLVKTVANVVMLLAIFGLAKLLGYPPEIVRASLILGLGYALGTYAENLAAYFQAHERMYVWTQASAIFGFVSGLGGIGLVLATRDLVLFCVSPAVGWAAALVWLLVRAPADVRWGGPARGADVAELLRSLAPFAAGFALMVVYYKVDVLMLAEWRSVEEVGVYSASYKVVDIFQALMVVASGAVYPRLSRLARERGREGITAGGRSTELLLLAALPAAGVTYFLADPLVGFLFGSSYAEAGAVLARLALVLPLLAVTIHSGYVLAAAGHMGTVAWMYVLGVLANVSLNVALIPSMGGQGAALAMLASEATLAAGFLGALRRLAGAGPRPATLLAVLLALVGGVAVHLGVRGMGDFASAAVFLAYLLALYPLTGAFGAREVRVVAAVLRPGRRVRVGS